MSICLHKIVLINRKSEGRTQRIRRKYLAVCSLLLFAILMSAAIVCGQTVTSPAKKPPKGKTAYADNESAALSIDSLQASESNRKVASSSRESQITVHKPNLRREKPFTYSSGGRRDPFRPLISESKKDEKIETDLLQVNGAVLTGVVWSGGEYLAMVRDKDGKTFFLREGDAVFRGTVTTVTQTKAVFRLVDFGEVERVTLTVRSNEGNK